MGRVILLLLPPSTRETGTADSSGRCGFVSHVAGDPPLDVGCAMHVSATPRELASSRRIGALVSAMESVEPLHLVVVDMDGTFLAPDGRVSDRNRKLVAKLAQQQVPFAVATGRPAAALQPIIDNLGIALPTVTFNGACLQTAAAGAPSQPLWEQPLPSAGPPPVG